MTIMSMMTNLMPFYHLRYASSMTLNVETCFVLLARDAFPFCENALLDIKKFFFFSLQILHPLTFLDGYLYLPRNNAQCCYQYAFPETTTRPTVRIYEASKLKTRPRK